MTKNTPIILSIAGSDCSAGAGIQADLKSAHSMGAYALTAITCVVSEIPGCVRKVEAISAETIADQVELMLESYPIGAIKTGMLWNAEIISTIASILKRYPKIPVVVDPVMIASSGDTLFQQNAIEALTNNLLPNATLLTPNMDETSTLLGEKISTRQELIEGTRQLAQKLKIAVLGKGGHLPETEDKFDILVEKTGAEHSWTSPTIPGIDAHGTGCSLSSAIAARIAAGDSLPQAVETARNFVAKAILERYIWDSTKSLHALHH